MNFKVVITSTKDPAFSKTFTVDAQNSMVLQQVLVGVFYVCYTACHVTVAETLPHKYISFRPSHTSLGTLKGVFSPIVPSASPDVNKNKGVAETAPLIYPDFGVRVGSHVFSYLVMTSHVITLPGNLAVSTG